MGLFRLDNTPPSPKEPQTEKTSIKEGGAKVALLLVLLLLQLEEVPLAFLKGRLVVPPGSSVIQAGRGPGHAPFL